MSFKLFFYLCVFAKFTESAKHKSQRLLFCTGPGFRMIEGKFIGEKHWLCLKMINISGSSLSKNDTVLLLDPDAEVGHRNTREISHLSLAHGYLLEDPTGGSAEGYIGRDNEFHGILYLRNKILHADPHGTDDLNMDFGNFDNDNFEAPRSRRQIDPTRLISQQESSTKNIPLDRPIFDYRILDSQPMPGVQRARICELLLLADKEYFVRDGHSNLDTVVTKMMHAVAQADLIFRNSDFDEDGKPDNVGFSVKYILVLTSEETNERVFGKMTDHDVVDGKLYLTKFARLRRLSDVCLGAAFSGHAFQNGTLGLSFTSLGGSLGNTAGGLCDRRIFGISYNVMAIAHAAPTCRFGSNDRTRVPERVAALTLAHELGHSFGAQHDNEYQDEECQGYLMGSHSSRDISLQQYEFSHCSKKMITTTMNSMGYCLIAEDLAYCGNGIVEKGEECDCGIPALCENKDRCCTPRGGSALAMEETTLHKEGCSVSPNAECHPSQGLCCKPDCKKADLEKYGINCMNKDEQCKCNEPSCHCGLGGRCLPDSTCVGAECAKLGLRECRCPPQYGLNPALSSAFRCGVCCTLEVEENKTECMRAELVARLVDQQEVPYHWPDEEYLGPNVTVQLCDKGVECVRSERILRAWPIGSFCVAENTVGLCSPKLVCEVNSTLPLSNIFPMTLTGNTAISNMKRQAELTNILVFVTVIVSKNLNYKFK